MFNLESSITEWRREMLRNGIGNPVPLEELESHLRDEIERLMQSGQSGHSAFDTAVQCIGKPQSLQAEFMKSRTMRGYKLSGIINSSVGAFLLLLAAASVGFEIKFPSLGHSLSWAFLPGAFFHFTLGYFHRRHYLRLAR